MAELGTTLFQPVGRRTALLGGVAIGAVPGVLVSTWDRASPALVRDRLELVGGARSGEVTTQSAVLWARSAGDGRMTVKLSSNGRTLRSLRGDWADERTDHTARLMLDGLAPGREYDATMWFTAPDGTRGTPETIRFRTAPVHAAEQSFVWSGDTCGQGFGINEELGGLTAYDAMRATRPDFFIHCGDTIYGDEPIEARVDEGDGNTWHNLVTEETSTVAETLEQFRGRHRYPLLDAHVRRFYAEVPTVSQWDDHETANNWYPGEQIDDDRFTVKSCDVLAARGRRAWQEYQPVPVRRLVDRGDDGFASQRIYRKVARGAHLDVFCLDMRSYRGDNPEMDPVTGRVPEKGILGPTQERWLVDELTASTATWKVISADLPLAIPSSHLDDLDGPSQGDNGQPIGREPEIARILTALKRNGVTNVVWITADVHYTAAHHYDPERAAYADFDPFWEFVSGPIASGTFEVKAELDETFGPQVEFSKGNESAQWAQSPRQGNQFFGHMSIARDGALTVTLYDGQGTALWRRTLEPELAGGPATRPGPPARPA